MVVATRGLRARELLHGVGPRVGVGFIFFSVGGLRTANRTRTGVGGVGVITAKRSRNGVGIFMKKSTSIFRHISNKSINNLVSNFSYQFFAQVPIF